ncbi:hypothetical protein H8N03_04015 [Ramlibacter sp. USB13]|uniref:RcnB family protein n=1 Tax=Ramlibacter cellulosilyticus TaxID=2764187 RepID=A0A923SDN6_9BURK|nr:hypothetical protein [Ramlibacter cellulosilyticus]MBC5782097.1 hypothetical protein [Ramlibacter cellulosilyticus]
MNTTTSPARLLAIVLACAFAAAPVLAKNDKHEDKHEHKHGRKQADERGHGPRQGAFFTGRHRDSVHTYYASGKHCPPGLAKKNNGCMPPGQAKKQWNVGQPLPTTVVIAPVPQQIIVTLPPVPVGHKYVQVAGDILLVAAGSMMVVDGINGLMR